MSEQLDVAHSPLRAPERLLDWTLGEVCKYGWVPKRIKISYKFSLRAPGDVLAYDYWEVYEYQGTEHTRVCMPENWELVDEGGAGEKWFGMDAAEPSYQFREGLGRHDRLPIFFSGLAFATEYYYSGDDNFYVFEAALQPSEDPSAEEWPDALEVVTADKDGLPVSRTYPLFATSNGGDFPFTEPEYIGAPYGFQFEYGDFIKYEVLEWLSYNGTYDTETGALLADPWRTF